jgi:dipeptidyl aminopeptidase/acylaminoacyl peptidase
MARILEASLLSIVLLASCGTPGASPDPSSAAPTEVPADGRSLASPVTSPSLSPSPSSTPNPTGPVSPVAEQLIAYTSGHGDQTAIRTVRADGQQDRFLARGDSPAWSPDGRLIAYRCRAMAETQFGDICVMNDDGTNPHRVVTDAISPSWSPDGSRILFSRSPIDLGDTWVADADGSNPTEIGPGAGSWSPDGTLILMLGASGAAPDAAVIRPDGTGERPLGDCWNAAWSPDSRRLACTGWDEVHGTVKAIDVATGSVTTLFTTDTAIGDPAWVSPSVLAITITRPGSDPSAASAQNDLHLLDLGTGTTRKLTSGLSIMGPIDVSSDGAWLAFAVPAGAGTDVAANDVYIASTSGEVRRLTTGGTSSRPTGRPLTAPLGRATTSTAVREDRWAVGCPRPSGVLCSRRSPRSQAAASRSSAASTA